MPGLDGPRPPLPEWILECYEYLRSHADERADEVGSGRSIEYEAAVDSLSASRKLMLEREDAKYALARLLERGYFYEVDDELRVTMPDQDCCRNN
ncbi:hypothetical protein [Natrialba swarupiae]|uniref:Uncharacterized protein n=1 Tax=Natrialba swarupiae TaxID=2448032 RepID=A0A5D5AJ29_9EURY|nr:hypothetical protein [Natrialba swarupiae]MCW8173343.1 hypothetical protein [Natrialba swarupiae]TYT60943.1 hypothetical protein FYC77_16185 [Natrialba swarupiae]